MRIFLPAGIEGDFQLTENLSQQKRWSLHPIALAAALLPLCWLAMQIVHEAGHVVGAWVTGGKVTAVVLHPLAISRTDVVPNPRPLVVVWGGPVVGVLVPLICWAVSAYWRLKTAHLWRFFAGFCLIANGAYLGSGMIEPIGDASDLLRHGARLWHLMLFAIVTVIAGFALWHGQGPQFGWGRDGEAVPLKQIALTWGCLLVLVVSEVIWTYATGFK